MFEILSSEESAGATRWDLPPLSGQESKRAPEKNGRLNTAAHLDEIEKAAYDEGFARGRAEGLANGSREAQAVAARMGLLLDHLSRPLKDLGVEVEHALIRLVVDTARKLVNEAIALDPARVAGAVQEALSALTTSTRDLKIFLHPDDLPVMQQHLIIPADANWKLLPDATLARGDCRVVSESSQVDARLDTRQTNIERALLGEDA